MLDPFCGSGTVPLACVQTDCHYVGIELEHSLVLHVQRRVRAGAVDAFANVGLSHC